MSSIATRRSILRGLRVESPVSTQVKLLRVLQEREFTRVGRIKTFEEQAGNQTRAAEALGISRDNLRYRVKKYGIQRGS